MGHDHDHEHQATSNWMQYFPAMLSSVLLVGGVVIEVFFSDSFTHLSRLCWFVAAFLPVGLPVASKGLRLAVKGDVFTEFTLMTIATVGAFLIGEYPEAVAVMLFYTIGEYFQNAAVARAKRNIRALLDVRPAATTVVREGVQVDVTPHSVDVGETVLIKSGAKVPLDGTLLSKNGTFNASALTGESQPVLIDQGGAVLAGMINLERPVEMQTTKRYEDSSLARMLALIQDATQRKAKTEQFIRRFSRIYTPAVVLLAVGIVVIPFLFSDDYLFREWLYRALIFLVISCPCALVISIPLGYFGGIGAASRNGVLLKGSNYLDLMARINTVVLDKTGTLTKGTFQVTGVVADGMEEKEWLPLVGAIEATSSHPIAMAIVAYAGGGQGMSVEHVEEIKGLGMRGIVAGKHVLVGNVKLLKRHQIEVDERWENERATIVAVAVEGRAVGYFVIADEIKADSKTFIQQLHDRGIETTILSGDRQTVVDSVAQVLGIRNAYGDLLPEDKVEFVAKMKSRPGVVLAFAGDGINDAPALAMSDVGIAMGGFGTDVAIEAADVIIQTDQPSKIIQVMEIGRATNRVVWQNIGLAFGVKVVVLVLGAGGLATMWEAVFADVGVALLAILNATRIQRKQF